ncbi:MAG: 50S ribosomal protein L15 [Elusimicrobia bacterium]|nr:50S ribosomal protein L15 [Elusimicrobiota bacterium]
MGLHNLKPAPGSRHRKKIVGRGEGSGHGGSATRGMKGQKSRSGDGKMVGFEGGQMPLLRRIPKRGFTNKFRHAYEIVNVKTLELLFDAGQEVTPELLKEKGVNVDVARTKILGEGEIKKALTVKAHSFSAVAKDKIVAAGGKIEILK